MHRFPSPIRSLALAALVAIAAPAVHAQSSVTLFGLIDMSVGRSQAPGASAVTNVDSGNMTTSFFGFKGSEDLGGGMSAVYALESFIRVDNGANGRFNGDGFWARNSYVGLSSGAGTVTVGRNTTSLFVNTLLFNAFGDSFGFSPAIRHTFTSGGNFQVSGDTGWSDSIKYSSPNFGGLSFTLHAALGEDPSNVVGGGRNLGASALYFGGPFAAGFSWQSVKKGTTTPDTNSWQLGGSYNFAPFKVFAQYGSTDNKTANNTTKVIGLGGEMVVGELGKVLLQWNRLNTETVDADRTTFSAGYDYQISKRTDLYVVYMNDKLPKLSAGTSYALGIRHRF
jgi:predicted porin